MFSLTVVGSRFMFCVKFCSTTVLLFGLAGCERKQDTPVVDALTSPSRDLSPIRDLRLEFNKLANFLGTKTPRVYWLTNNVTDINRQYIGIDGNYSWIEPAKNGRSYHEVRMKVTSFDYDSVQKIGTVVWTVDDDRLFFDQRAWDSANALNEQSKAIEDGQQALDIFQGKYDRQRPAGSRLDPEKSATTRIKSTRSYKATFYFSNEWVLQKVEISRDASDYKILDDDHVKTFFEEAMKASQN